MRRSVQYYTLCAFKII